MDRGSFCRPKLGFIAAIVLCAAGVVRAEAPVGLFDAAEAGSFNVGAATARFGRYPDADLGRDVLRLEFSLPSGTAAGYWSKRFPPTFAAGSVDALRLRTRRGEAGDSVPPRLEAAVELKGSAGIQRVPLPVADDWRRVETTLDWPAIGTLNEVVLLVRPLTNEPVEGDLLVDATFDRLSLLEQASARVEWRLLIAAAVAAAGGVVAGVAGLGRNRSPGKAAGPTIAMQTRPGIGNLRREIVLSIAVVATAGLVLATYHLAARPPFQAAAFAATAALIGGLLAFATSLGMGLGRPSFTGVFQDALVTGLLAAAASPVAILQAPAAAADFLRLSPLVAATAIGLYHTVQLRARAAGTDGLRPVAAAAFLLAPLLVGSLTSLQSDGLMRAIGGGLLPESGVAWLPAAVGRTAIVFVFNVGVAQLLALLVRGRFGVGPAGHLAMLATAAAVVAAAGVATSGSSGLVLSVPPALRPVYAILATMVAHACLWAEVYLITGMALDALRSRPPTSDTVHGHMLAGAGKGAVYSGVFMTVLHLGHLVWTPAVQSWAAGQPVVAAALVGAMMFPLVKTVVETFDGSTAFFRRAAASYSRASLYLRGAVVGVAVGWGIQQAIDIRPTGERAWFGFVFGAAAFAGVNAAIDLFRGAAGQGGLRHGRVYLVDGLLGGFIGAAVAFYLDQQQIGIVLEKIGRYVAFDSAPRPYDVYPLLSKWGFIRLGDVTGGVRLLWNEALVGVISWSIPAWLFALNRTFMAAWFQRQTAPIRGLFTPEGLLALGQNMIEVLRWGLWMSPIINSFLRPVGDPTWYNQDGLLRTGAAVVQDLRLGPEGFRAWSLQIFIYLLAFDWVRIAIWLDHMGLRVATLVNLSFLGMDRLDARIARWLGPEATARHVPEGVKRFTTWVPLLIPYYIPQGREWDAAWSGSEELARSTGVGWTAALASGLGPRQFVAAAIATLGVIAFFRLLGWGRGGRSSRPAGWRLSHGAYEVVVGPTGAVHSHARRRGFDVSRRAYDLLDPAGRALFVVDTQRPADDPARVWPVVGNDPGGGKEVERRGDRLFIRRRRGELAASVEITIPNRDDAAEVWTIELANAASTPRRLKVAPYLEWVLNRPDADRNHTQYNRLFAEMEYLAPLGAVLAWDRHTKAMGVLAVGPTAEGFLTSRVDFIGRAGTLWRPVALRSLAFAPAVPTDAHPTLDPIAALLLSAELPAGGIWRGRLLIGLARDRDEAVAWIGAHLGVRPPAALAPRARKRRHHIGHGAPPAPASSYAEFVADGRGLVVRTPQTPRPFDHTLANALGHVVVLTNRGLGNSSSVNSQQNRLTPDWPDIVTRELPGEAFYLFDPERQEWYPPTPQPADGAAETTVELSAEGRATYRARHGSLRTELVVFVPPDEPAGVYQLTVQNDGPQPRRLRVAAYFQLVIAGQPESAGRLRLRYDPAAGVLWFDNPRNTYRRGEGFLALSAPVDVVETDRGRFFGRDRGPARPYLVEHGQPDVEADGDPRQVAAMLTTIDVPAGGEETVVAVFGQADTPQLARQAIERLRRPAGAAAAMHDTRDWWSGLLGTMTVKTDRPEFERLLDWLKYQALAERVWARRGFYQASGAYGFRDQLQDSVNLLWVDPAIARRQIALCASQQFLEGDVVHWFHVLEDGRTGFAARTHASDNLLWLAWAAAEYLGATGDAALLDRVCPYLESELPFEPLPRGKHGMGFEPLRSAVREPIYRHCLRAIDLVLERRMGRRGLPLIGTGDWNDGLDEIGSQGRGESVWLGFFLYYILQRFLPEIGRRDGPLRQEHYQDRADRLRGALEATWRGDRYLRAVHDDGTEIGLAGSGVWEIDALTAAWAVMAGVNGSRGRTVFDTALATLEKEETLLLGWPPLREDTKPYLGRSSGYPEGVRENGMYCHGVQWLVGAARMLAVDFHRQGNAALAASYQETAWRLWLKISPIPHTAPGRIETYGGQPNKQAADMVTTFDPGRMIWHGYTGAAGWMLRQGYEAILGLRLVGNQVVVADDVAVGAGERPRLLDYRRQLAQSPFARRPAGGGAATKLERGRAGEQIER